MILLNDNSTLGAHDNLSPEKMGLGKKIAMCADP